MLAHGLLNHCGNSQEDMQAPLKTSETFQVCSVFLAVKVDMAALLQNTAVSLNGGNWMKASYP